MPRNAASVGANDHHVPLQSLKSLGYPGIPEGARLGRYWGLWLMAGGCASPLGHTGMLVTDGLPTEAGGQAVTVGCEVWEEERELEGPWSARHQG